MTKTPALTAPVTERDHRAGSDNAPLTLVEYGDYQCPYCGRAHPMLKRLQQALGDRLRLVFRNFPLTQIHDHAHAAAETAEAAALLGQFWPMHDYIFEHQRELSSEALANWVHQIGLPADQFEAALRDPEVEKHISEDRYNGIRSGVNGTPTFYINGERYDGDLDYESLYEALNYAWEALPGASAGG